MPEAVLGHSEFPVNCMIEAIKAILPANPVNKKYKTFHFFNRCEISGTMKQIKITRHIGMCIILGHPSPVLNSSITNPPAPNNPIISRARMLRYVVFFNILYNNIIFVFTKK